MHVTGHAILRVLALTCLLLLQRAWCADFESGRVICSSGATVEVIQLSISRGKSAVEQGIKKAESMGKRLPYFDEFDEIIGLHGGPLESTSWWIPMASFIDYIFVQICVDPQAGKRSEWLFESPGLGIFESESRWRWNHVDKFLVVTPQDAILPSCSTTVNGQPPQTVHQA